MSQENLVICYEGIQRIYRNSIVRFLRSKLYAAFPNEWEKKLRSPFQKEWDTIKQNASLPRISGELTTQVRDDFDLLSINHFFNLFDAYYDVLLSVNASGSADEKKKQKQALLNWVRTIKNLRDPLSHPTEEDFSREDSFSLLDCARRVLLRINLVDEASKIQELMNKILEPSISPSPLLEDRLPPRESIVSRFIGRDKELSELQNWFYDPTTRRWALAGEGGKGKSALAYQFALEIKQAAPKPYQAVFWLSAKKRKFLEGVTIPVEAPDFSDLDSAFACLLTHYGWIEETAEPTETKRNRILELLNAFPALVVIDDIDSLETENENVIEFFSLEVPRTQSKVLFTSRRTIFGMGGSTTHVSGFSDQDAEAFIRSRCEIMELDPAIFDKKTVQRIVKITDGSPLFIEDLVRLTAIVPSAKDAVELWEERGGYEARKYALGRECELLMPNARKVLFAATNWLGPVSFVEIEAVTGMTRDSITAALQELQKLFLAPKPRLIEGEERFEVNLNTRALVRDVYGSSKDYSRILNAYKTISEGESQKDRGAVGALIRQAIYLLRASKLQEAEEHLLRALQRYDSDPDLIGVLGLVYKSWHPPRLTDAREKFRRAWQLRGAKRDIYEHWCRMEIKENEWSKAAEAAENGLKVLIDNRTLLYLSGYSFIRLARELLTGLHQGKAQKEIEKARNYLERSLKVSEQADGKEKTTNADIYRSLVLVCEMASDSKSMEHYFRLWRKEYPDDPDAESEWNRVSRKYALKP